MFAGILVALASTIAAAFLLPQLDADLCAGLGLLAGAAFVVSRGLRRIVNPE